VTAETSEVVTTAGAELYVEQRGDGPPLLMIAGGGGDAGFFSLVGDLLADSYRVITYDRRGNSRSSRRGGPMEVAQEADDALAVLQACDVLPALVFGTSGGAIVGLDLAARHPGAVAGLVAHEPPVVEILPDADVWRAHFAAVDALYREQGHEAAEALFQSEIGFAETFAPRPEAAEALQRIHRNFVEMFYVEELLPFTGYVPDVERIRANGTRVVMGLGDASRGRYYGRTPVLLAEQLDCPLVDFPGHHVAYLEEPERFVAALRTALSALGDAGASSTAS